jgi:hypothetical protein
MRVLSTEEFVKKVYKATNSEIQQMPSIEVRANWQLLLTIPCDDGEPDRWLGPNPGEMKEDDYTVFLSKIDIMAGASFATHFVQDRMPS